MAAALLPFAGRLATCGTVLLEVGWSATSREHYEQMMDDLAWYQLLEIDQGAIDLARDLQSSLAEGGHHRGPGMADLILAATAIVHSAVVLHYDQDFQLIGEVEKRLQHRWIVSRGTV